LKGPRPVPCRKKGLRRGTGGLSPAPNVGDLATTGNLFRHHPLESLKMSKATAESILLQKYPYYTFFVASSKILQKYGPFLNLKVADSFFAPERLKAQI
jgi:hypothetical protein